MNSANISPTRSLKRLSPRSPRPSLLDSWLEFNTADPVLTETPALWFPWHVAFFTFFLSLSADRSCWPSLQTLLFMSVSLRLPLGGSWSPFSSVHSLGRSAVPTADVIIHTPGTVSWAPHSPGAWHLGLRAPWHVTRLKRSRVTSCFRT